MRAIVNLLGSGVNAMRMLQSTLGFVLVVGFAHCVYADGPPQTVHGIWTLSEVKNGPSLIDAAERISFWFRSDGSFELREQSKISGGRFQLKEEKGRQELDVKFNNSVSRFLYRIEDNKLHIAFGNKNDERPKDFATASVFIFNRSAGVEVETKLELERALWAYGVRPVREKDGNGYKIIDFANWKNCRFPPNANAKLILSLKDIRTMQIINNDLTTDELAGLSSLAELQELELCNADLDDNSLLSLQKLKKLRVLSIYGFNCGGNITRVGVKAITEHSGLEELRLMCTWSKFLDFASLEKLSKLKVLKLQHAEVADAEAKQISTLTKLRELELPGNRISDEGVKYLSGLTALESLNLSGGNISDRGAKTLSGLVNLRYLRLVNTRLGNDGLIQLKSLVHLRNLIVFNTNVTDAGVAALQKELPKCNIEWR